MASDPLVEWPVENWVDYVGLIQDAVKDGESMWFRGVGNASYKLIPSLFRHPARTEGSSLLELERELIQRFQERSIPFRTELALQASSGEWEELFIMQHFGFPTRLLDWTENPHIALFFALTSASFDKKTGEAEADVAVWALRPGLWNQHALEDIAYTGGVLSIGASQLEGYKPQASDSMMRRMPVAMWGVHNSPRIVAQRGVFTIFGKSLQAMEDAYLEKSFEEKSLRKIVIPAEKVRSLLDVLTRTGITDSTVYPDLQGLAMELRRQYGYPV